VRSGYILLIIDAGTLRHNSYHGHYWSSRGSSMRSDGVTTPSAYNLYFHTTVVTPSDSTDRYRGFPLRCLSTVLGM